MVSHTSQPDLDILYGFETLYKPAGYSLLLTQIQEESSEYQGVLGRTAQYAFLFRCSKITPTKVGQFVTLWKRPTPNGKIAPFDIQDGIDFVVIAVRDGHHQGQFIFPSEVLRAQKIFSEKGIGGKRAFRIYPSWVSVDSNQALRTKKWQEPFYLPLENSMRETQTLLKKLLY